jgi:hypothetical protein
MVQKPLHGRYPHDLGQKHVDTEASSKWLTSADLFAETEGFLTAIQDQDILTKNYKKYILNSQTLMSCAEDVEKNRRQSSTLLQHVSTKHLPSMQKDMME